jgi:DNA-binding transcriptional ArsR family regulator
MLPDDMDAVFQALAHRDRRRLLDLVRNNPGCCVEQVAKHFDTSRIAVLKHLRVLTRAQLLHSQKIGRQRKLYFNVVPIQLVYDRWATQYSSLWAGKLAGIKYRIETSDETGASSNRPGPAPRKRHA